MNAPSGIQTYDLSVRMVEDDKRIKPHGHCDRLLYLLLMDTGLFAIELYTAIGQISYPYLHTKMKKMCRSQICHCNYVILRHDRKELSIVNQPFGC
jgi:hypothetical protein